MLITEAHSGIVSGPVADAHPAHPDWTHTVSALAGTTWSQVHDALNSFRLAPLVQQSSPHFTVGGSLSVNCHGRDPRQGPVSSTVKSIQVLCGDGAIREASRTLNPDLFEAVLGGYGSCGLIVQATFWVTTNTVLERTAREMSLSDYQSQVSAWCAPASAWPADIHMHYGWLDFSAASGFQRVLSVDYTKTPAIAPANEPLVSEQLGTLEMMSAAWMTAADHPSFRDKVWALVCEEFSKPIAASRLNVMRATVGFSMHKRKADGSGKPGTTDLLQEFMFPVTRLVPAVESLEASFNQNTPEKLLFRSATFRIVQPDTLTNLSYCRNGPMLCMAIDFTAALADTDELVPEVNAWAQQLTSRLLSVDGATYYLPYYRFQNRRQHFEKAYAAGLPRQRGATQRYNPDRRWNNEFLKAYLL